MFFSLSEFDESEDSLDELLVIVRSIPRRIFSQNRPELFDTLGEAEFRDRFRLNKTIVLEIRDRISEQIAPRNQRRNTISSINQILITLR